MKTIKVNSCMNCPYSKNEHKQGYVLLICTHEPTKNFEINNPDIIEKWCEL